MGTDAGTPFNYHGENALELRYMVNIGIKPADALIAATSNAAELNRLADHGRLEAGAVADLLIVEGNPVENIDAAGDKANHRAVIKGGELVAGASRALADHVTALLTHFPEGEEVSVILGGGLIGSDTAVRQRTLTELATRAPQARVFDAEIDPAAGALRMAAKKFLGSK